MPSVTTTGTGEDSLVLMISEDAYQGDAQFTVSIDGNQLGGTFTATQSHTAGIDQNFTFKGDWLPGTHTVTVNFLNDKYGGTPTKDRNLYVDSITYDGASAGVATELASNGPKSFAVAGPQPVTTGSGSDTLVLSVSEDAYQGNAQFTVSVDGKQLGGTFTTVALHALGASQTFTFMGDWAPGAHTIAVNFLNDAWDGTATTDRNLYVNAISYDGTNTGQSAPLYTNGAKSFVVTDTTPVPSALAYYVAVNGNDTTGDGSAAHPFATLKRAQSAMETSSIHSTVVEGGTYNLTAGLSLTSLDNGMSFISAPGQHAVLNGGSAGLLNLVWLNGTQNVTLQGLTFENTTPGYSNGAVLLTNATSNRIVGNLFSNDDLGVLLRGSNNNVISGNEFDNSVTAGIAVGSASNNNTIDSNLINGTSLSTTSPSNGGIFITGGSNNTITHNLVENTAGPGISLVNWNSTDPSNLNTGDTIAYNSVVNSVMLNTDSGGIYIDGVAGADTKIVINNNSINMASTPTTGLSVGIYLDDWTSGVTATNNIVTAGNFGFLIHGGQNNAISNNIFDMGTRTASNVGAGLLQSESGGPIPTMTGDEVLQNIIYSTATGPSTAWVSYGGIAGIANNLYYNANGQLINTAGMDTNPETGDPQFVDAAAGNYALGAGSASATIGFQSINQAAMGLAPTTAHWY